MEKKNELVKAKNPRPDVEANYKNWNITYWRNLHLGVGQAKIQFQKANVNKKTGRLKDHHFRMLPVEFRMFLVALKRFRREMACKGLGKIAGVKK